MIEHETNETSRGDFTVCPHCWHVNPAARICARCLSDMTLLLQESGGRRWTAPTQSPVPIRARERLSRWQRRVLLGALLLYGIAQLSIALGGGQAGALFQERPPVRTR